MKVAPLRLTMALKSGMPLEIAWALNTLTVMLHDDTSASQISLADVPSLLDSLVKLYRHYLIQVFPFLAKTMQPKRDCIKNSNFGVKMVGAKNSMCDDVTCDREYKYKRPRTKNYSTVTRDGKRVKFECKLTPEFLAPTVEEKIGEIKEECVEEKVQVDLVRFFTQFF